MQSDKKMPWKLGLVRENLRQTQWVKSVHIRRYSGPHFLHSDWIRRNTPISPYSLRMLENADQKNSEYWQFLRSDMLWIWPPFVEIPFQGNFFPNFKIVYLKCNLVPRLIPIWRIQCWCSLSPFLVGNTILGQIFLKHQNRQFTLKVGA